jgi:Translin family
LQQIAGFQIPKVNFSETMSFRGGRRGNYRNNNSNNRDNTKKSEVSEADSNNPVIAKFQIYQTELDQKHDRHERLVKASRDITIESKRIIFLLHNIDSR